MSDCLFCKIAAKEIPSTLVHEEPDLLAFKDIGPKAPTHILVIPRKHIATVNDLTDADATLVGRLVLTAKKIAAEGGIAESGYRLVVNCNAGAGQTVFHLHVHLLGGRTMKWPPG